MAVGLQLNRAMRYVLGLV